MKRNSVTAVETCPEKIREKLGLITTPDITVNMRCYEGPDKRGHYNLPVHREYVDEPAEDMRDSHWFDKVLYNFRYEYIQLPRDTDRRIPYAVYLMEPLVRLGRTTITGGFNWVVMGTLENGEKYAAILDVEVRPMLRGCSLMTLMKLEEIELARREKCDFIQTWHWSDNPSFIAAIAPGLSAGFGLYHGDRKDGEQYEDKGCVHLRYYFDRKKMKKVRVVFRDGAEFESPRNNSEIIDYLKRFTKYPGRAITKIEGYEREYSHKIY